MEKYSNSPFKDFVRAIKGVKFKNPKAEDKVTSDIHRVTSATKILVNLSKMASYISEDINPLKLKSLLFKEFGSEWLDWLPEILEQELLKTKKSDIISNKAQALRIGLSTDAPWREWHIFEKVGTALNSKVPDFNIMQPLSLGECETTMRVLEELRDEPFTEEVLTYVAVVAFTNNIVYLPTEWKISKATKQLDILVFDFDLKNKVYWAWNKLKDKDLIAKSFKEDSLQRQLARLVSIKQYVQEF